MAVSIDDSGGQSSPGFSVISPPSRSELALRLGAAVRWTALIDCGNCFGRLQQSAQMRQQQEPEMQQRTRQEEELEHGVDGQFSL